MVLDGVAVEFDDGGLRRAYGCIREGASGLADCGENSGELIAGDANIFRAQCLSGNTVERRIRCVEVFREQVSDPIVGIAKPCDEAVLEYAGDGCDFFDRIHQGRDKRTILKGEIAVRAGADGFGDGRCTFCAEKPAY